MLKPLVLSRACGRSGLEKNYMLYFVSVFNWFTKLPENKSCLRLSLVNIYCQQSAWIEVWLFCGCLKKSLKRSLSVVPHWRRFEMYELERKGIIFDAIERRRKQTSSKRNEEFIRYLTYTCNLNFVGGNILIFPSRGGSYGAIVFCFCLSDFTPWGFHSTTWKKIPLNFRWRYHFNTLIIQKGSSNSEMVYSCWWPWTR